ncbi:hypothetical protein RsTz2092_10200 [Deferribacterales bacterium RsTz2092]|nr:hypothetical protein AGMMS49941_08230 [Deferribacterales bacterium]
MWTFKRLFFCALVALVVACNQAFEPAVMSVDSAGKLSIPVECREYYAQADGQKLNIYIDSFSTKQVRDVVVDAFNSLGTFNILPQSTSRMSSTNNRLNLAKALGADYVVSGSQQGAGKITITIIDATSGQPLVENREIVVQVKTKGLFIASVVDEQQTKMALDSALKRELQLLIPVRSYIIQLRGGGGAALINTGSESGIAAGMLFRPLDISIEADVISGKKFCHLTPLPFTMSVSDYVNKTGAWLKTGTGNDKLLKTLKIGTIVERMPSRQN